MYIIDVLQEQSEHGVGVRQKIVVGYERIIHLVHMHSSGLMGDFGIEFAHREVQNRRRD